MFQGGKRMHSDQIRCTVGLPSWPPEPGLPSLASRAWPPETKDAQRPNPSHRWPPELASRVWYPLKPLLGVALLRCHIHFEGEHQIH